MIGSWPQTHLSTGQKKFEEKEAALSVMDCPSESPEQNPIQLLGEKLDWKIQDRPQTRSTNLRQEAQQSISEGKKGLYEEIVYNSFFYYTVWYTKMYILLV